MTTELTQCCGRPPRLISKAGFGYAVVCMSCGLGMMDETPSSTFQSAAHEWEEKKASWHETPQGPAKVLLKELVKANEVLRNTACVLGAGGYNATEVDADVFQSKISDGIGMLTTPMQSMIDEGRARIKELEAEVARLRASLVKEFVASVEENVDEPQVTTGKISDTDIVITAELKGVKYECQRNGYVRITSLARGTSSIRHIHSIGVDGQNALNVAADLRVRSHLNPGVEQC